jgi:hypothetical protein
MPCGVQHHFRRYLIYIINSNPHYLNHTDTDINHKTCIQEKNHIQILTFGQPKNARYNYFKKLSIWFFSRYDCVYLYEFHVFLIGFTLLNAYLIDRVRVMPWELRCIIQEKTSFYSVFDNSCYPDNNANHMLLTSDLNSFRGRDCAHAPL